jgi:signal transduction histidine kinase
MGQQEFLDELKAYVGFSDQHAHVLAELGPHLEPGFGGIIERFYEAVERTPRAVAVFTGGKPQIERQKRLLHEWLHGLTSGIYDLGYLERRSRIGRAHVRIKLEQRYMLTAMNLVREGLHGALDASAFAIERRALGHAALDKICDLELAIMLETYAEDHAIQLRDRERLATLGKVAASVEACIVGLDAAGNVCFANGFATERIGGGGGFVGRHFSELCSASDLRDASRAVARALAGVSVHDLECRFERQAAPPRTIRWTLTPLAQSAGEALPIVVASGVDITDRLALERKTIEAEAMAAMGVLTTGLAHEIRNPLNAAKLQLELLARRARRTGEADSNVVVSTGLIQGEIDRLSALLDEFLQLARPRPVEPRACSLAELFAGVLALEQPVAESAGIQLAATLPEDLSIQADPDKLKQVLLNLVANGVDALRERGQGRVELSAARKAGGGVSISVSDDGPGVPPEVAESAFTPFVTSKPAGTGLGLAIVRKIVAQHGGHAELLARPGGGTIARFHLPG